VPAHFPVLQAMTMKQKNIETQKKASKMKRLLYLLLLFVVAGAHLQAQNAVVSIPQLTNLDANQTITVPVNVNFSTVSGGVSAFQFELDYDAGKLTFLEITNAVVGSIEAIEPEDTSNKLRIIWTNPHISLTLNGTLFEISFAFTEGNSMIEFVESLCYISNNTGDPVTTGYFNGSVSSQIPGIALSHVSAEPPVQIDVPAIANGLFNVAGMSLRIGFDNLDVLAADPTVANIHPDLIDVGLRFGYTDNEIRITWSKNAGEPGLSFTDGVKLFDIRFNYAGGSSNIDFNPATSGIFMSDMGFNPFDPVNLVNGSIVEGGEVGENEVNLHANPDDIGATLTGAGSYEAGQTVHISTTTPTGYTFTGWTGDEAHLLNNSSNASTFFTMPEDDVTLIANFTENDFTVTVLLEGFHVGGGMMRKAQDFAGGQAIDKWEGLIADKITIELHPEGNYGTPAYTYTDVDLHTDGTAEIGLGGVSGSYYLTVKHRNHIETVSANPVNFNNTQSYDFTTAADKAYGNNQRALTGGFYGMYGGDVNGDGFINISDRSLVQAKIFNITTGYHAEDINGDGLINISDRSLVQSNVFNIIIKRTP
jgi:uncharacterized repeat protein (TIGR02543 family)